MEVISILFRFRVPCSHALQLDRIHAYVTFVVFDNHGLKDQITVSKLTTVSNSLPQHQNECKKTTTKLNCFQFRAQLGFRQPSEWFSELIAQGWISANRVLELEHLAMKALSYGAEMKLHHPNIGTLVFTRVNNSEEPGKARTIRSDRRSIVKRCVSGVIGTNQPMLD